MVTPEGLIQLSFKNNSIALPKGTLLPEEVVPFSGEDLVKNAHLFQNDLNLEKGDEVMVVGGELQGAKAVVERVSGRNVTLRTGKKRETVVEDRMEHLCKLFHDGKRVDVVSGSHQGKSGVVLSQQGFNVDIWTDNFHTITVNASNLARHRSDRTFRNDLGIKRNDLIRTAQGTLGVVLEVKKDSVSILNIHNKVDTVYNLDYDHRIDTNNLAAQNPYGGTLKPKCVVRINQGPYEVICG